MRQATKVRQTSYPADRTSGGRLLLIQMRPYWVVQSKRAMTFRYLMVCVSAAAATFAAAPARAEVAITNDTMVTIWSDSFARGPFGQRQNFFLASFFISYYPQYFISYRDHSRSGASNLEMLTNRVPR